MWGERCRFVEEHCAVRYFLRRKSIFANKARIINIYYDLADSIMAFLYYLALVLLGL